MLFYRKETKIFIFSTKRPSMNWSLLSVTFEGHRNVWILAESYLTLWRRRCRGAGGVCKPFKLAGTNT